MTDSSAASLQMIDEIQGIAGWKTRQPGDARHGKGKKGGTGILGVGCVLCWLFFLLNPASKPRAGPRAMALDSSLLGGGRTASQVVFQTILRAQFGQACVAGVWQACRRAEVQDPGSGTACHWPVTRRLKGTRVLRVGVGHGTQPAKQGRRDSLVGRLRVQCPPFGSCEQVNCPDLNSLAA